MKRINLLRLFQILIIKLSLSTLAVAQSQPPRTMEINMGLQKAASDLNASLFAAYSKWEELVEIPRDNEKVVNSLNRISQLLNRMNTWKYDNPAFNTVDFLNYKSKLSLDFTNYSELVNNSLLLEQVDSVIAIFSFIDEDISSKMASQSASGPVSGELVRIRVRVLEIGTSKELSGFRVFIKPAMTLSDRFVEELNPTNNAISEVIPGRKTVWIQKDNTVIAKRTLPLRYLPMGVTVDFSLDKGN